jgi:hypothetical protein
MVSILIQIAAALSQRENEAGLYRLEHFSQRLDRAYNRPKEELGEINCMVEKNENLWKARDNSVDFMLSYLYRHRYRDRY